MSILALLQNEDFQGVVAEIKERMRVQVSIVRSESDTVKLFRAQGSADALEALLDYLENEADEDRAREKQARERDDEEGE